LDLRPAGLDSYLNAGDVAAVDTLESFTLTTWLNLEGLNSDQGGSGNVRLVAKQGPAPDFNGFSWNLNTPNFGDRSIDNFRLGLFVGGVDSFAFAFSTDDTGAGNSWTFLAVTYDGTTSFDNTRFYVGDEVTVTSELGTPGSLLSGAVASTSGAADFGVGFTDADNTFDFSAVGFQDDVRVYDGALTLSQLEAVRLENLTSTSEPCDFNMDTMCNVADLDLMFQEGPIAGGVPVTPGVNDQFDLNGDDQISLADRDVWLADAATLNELGSPYKLGDATLDGIVDGLDFIEWNEDKFTSNLLWSSGNFNGDEVVDGLDFIEWNNNKFTSSDGIAVVPEPAAAAFFVIALAGVAVVFRGDPQVRRLSYSPR
jgi:hypothetical protein